MPINFPEKILLGNFCKPLKLLLFIPFSLFAFPSFAETKTCSLILSKIHPSCNFIQKVTVPEQSTVFPARHMIEVLKGIQKRKYDAIARLISEDTFSELVAIEKKYPHDSINQLSKVAEFLSDWKKLIRKDVVKINKRRDPHVTDGFSIDETINSEKEQLKTFKSFDGAVSSNPEADSDRNDLLMASSEISSLWEDLVVQFASAYHYEKEEFQSYFSTQNVDVPNIILSTKAGEDLDAKLNINGMDGQIQTVKMNLHDPRNVLTWFDTQIPVKEREPILLRLARIIETSNHYWIWVFLPIKMD